MNRVSQFGITAAEISNWDRDLVTQKSKNVYCLYLYWASLVTQMIKNLPAVWEMRVQSLGWKDPLEEGIATHSIILA